MLVIVALVMSGMGVIAPVLSVYAQSFGIGATMIGLTITVFGLGRLMVNIPTGLFTERHGRRMMMWAGPLILCIGSLGAAMADSFTALVFWRLVQGIGSGIYMTVAMASVADVSTPATRGRVMALYQTALLVGAGAGPALGGLIADHYGYRAPFWVFAVVAGLASLYAMARFRETLPAGKRNVAPRKPGGPGLGWSMIVRHRAFLAVTIITFGVFFTRTAAQWQLTPLIGTSRFGLSLGVVGLAMMAQLGANLLMLPIAGMVIDRFGQRRTILIGSYSLAFCLAAMALAPVVWAFFLSLAMTGVAVGITNPASAAYAADNAPEGRFGPAMGILRTVGDAGFVLGPILAGLAADLLPAGYAGGVLVNALVVLGGTFFFARASRPGAAKA